MQYKAIFSDVDGTLVPVGPHIQPTERVIRAIKKAQSQKVAVCIVSGRPMNWLKELMTTLSINNPCIINGGTQIVDPLSEEILWGRNGKM